MAISPVPPPPEYRTVATVAARNAIPTGQRTQGMAVFVTATTTRYELLAPPWTGTDADWAVFGSVEPYEPPEFDSFQIEGQGTRLGVGASIASGLKTFQWSTTNSSNVAANSISITDVTNETVLTSGQSNDGDYVYNLASPITHDEPATQVWRISGTDSLGNTFSADFTVTWVAVSANTFYVDPTGSNSNPGTSLLPWLTLAYAESQVEAGDTVIVRAGNYAGFQVTKSGVSGGPITFEGEEGAVITTAVTVGGVRFGVTSVGFEYRVFDGLGVDSSADVNQWNAGYRMSGNSGEWVHGNQIKNCPITVKIGPSSTGDQFCIRTSWWDGGLVDGNRLIGSWDTPNYFANSARDCTFSNNVVSNAWGNGPHNNGDESAGPPGVCYRLTFSNNIIYDVCLGGGGQALSFDGCQDTVVENNLVYNCHARCLAFFAVNSREGSTDNVVVNNTFVLAADGSVNVRLARFCEDITLFNNVILNVDTDAPTYRINDDALSGLACDVNALSSASPISIENVDGDTTDFTLAQWQFSERDVNSLSTSLTGVYGSSNPSSFFPIPAAPVIGAGLDDYNGYDAPTTDLSGNPRPPGENDIGAYEFVAGLPYVTAVTPLAGATGVLSGVCTMTTSENVTQASVVFSLVDEDEVEIAGTIGVVGAVITFTPTDPTDLLPSKVYTATLTDAATAGNLHIPGAVVWSFTTGDAPSIGPFSLFGTTVPELVDSGDTTPLELGMRFQSARSGRVTGARFYKASTNTGTHRARLYTNLGTLLGSGTFTGETASGWQECDLDAPVAITAGVTYVISYTDPNGHYSADSNYFASAVTRGDLTGVADGVSTPNGVFQVFGGFPDTSGDGNNYWVDVLLGLVVPYDGQTEVSLSATPSCVFNVGVQSGTITFELTDSLDQPVAGTSAYDAETRTATFTPDNPLSEDETYTAAVSGATVSGGTFVMTPGSWSFTTVVLPETVEVESKAPPEDATDVSLATTVEIVFNQDVDPETIVFELVDSGDTPVPGTDAYDDETFTWTFTPDDPLASEEEYTATLSAADASQGPAVLPAPVVWSFTTGVESYSLFGETVPGTVDSGDGDPYTMGVMVRVISGGDFTGVRFYKASANTGTHTGKLWNAAGSELATVTFSGETASGWQEATFSGAVTATVGNRYWLTVTMPSGHYSFDNNYWDTGVDNSGPLSVPVARSGELPAGFFSGSTPTFPNSFTNDNYWVDALISATAPVLQSLIADLQAFTPDDNGAAFTLGFRFSVDVPGTVVGIRFWRSPAETGTHTVKLWSDGGSELATGTSSDEFGNGWQYVRFNTPYSVSAGVTYVGSYLSNRFCGVANNYFASPVTNGHITAPANATRASSGDVFPTGTGTQQHSFGVDVLFVPD